MVRLGGFGFDAGEPRPCPAIAYRLDAVFRNATLSGNNCQTSVVVRDLYDLVPSESGAWVSLSARHRIMSPLVVVVHFNGRPTQVALVDAARIAAFVVRRLRIWERWLAMRKDANRPVSRNVLPINARLPISASI